MLFFPVSALLSIRCLCLICLVGSFMLPVCRSITYVFVAMPSQKTPFGMLASPTHPRNLPPPFFFYRFLFFPSGSRNEMRRIRQWRRSTERCVSTGAPLENTGAAGSFGPNQGLIGGWGGAACRVCRLWICQVRTLAFSLSDYLEKTEIELRGWAPATPNEIWYWPDFQQGETFSFTIHPTQGLIQTSAWSPFSKSRPSL